MNNDFFRATFAGGMVGAGADVFAVWGYVMAHEDGGTVELNPPLLALVLGIGEPRITAAIHYLQSPWLVKWDGPFNYRIHNYPKSKKDSRRTKLSADFVLTPERETYALAKGVVDPKAQMLEFHNHHKAHGKTMLDWDAAWRTWCGNVKKFAGRNQPQPVIKPARFPQ